MEEQIYYINSKNNNAFLDVDKYFSFLLSLCSHTQKKGPVFVCIGSDRVTGDSLGPLIGTELSLRLPAGIPVYGTLNAPLHAMNLNRILPQLKKKHQQQVLIAIDASLGSREHQGYITLGKGCLCPGAGVNKNLESVGDFFITGIVGISGPFSHLNLQTARLSSVMTVARPICDGILFSLQTLQV